MNRSPRLSFTRSLIPVVLAAACLFGTVGTVSAQGIGVVGGLNFTSVDDVSYQDAEATFESRSGYHLGLYLNLGLGPVELRPGLRYLKAGPLYEGIGNALRGDEVDGPDGIEDVRDDFNVNFVTVPIDAKLNLPFPIVNPYVFAGPEFRLQQASNAPDELDDDLNDWSYIGNFGVGASISLPGTGVTLSPEVRYSFGVSDLIDEEIEIGDRTITATDQSRSESFFISLGIEP